MIEDSVQSLITAAHPFEEWYQSLQEEFHYTYLNPTKEMTTLVTGQKNSYLPIYRWYNLKESFAAELPIWLYHWMKDHYQHIPTVVLDPFLGSGTTGVSLAQLNISVTGVEYNPFIHFVAATKASITQVSPVELRQAIADLEKENFQSVDIPIPSLSTLHNPKYSDMQDIKALLILNERIQQLDTSPIIRAMLRVGVAGTIESVFHLRKDGRALRYEPKICDKSVYSILKPRLHAISLDVEMYHTQNTQNTRQKPLYNVYQGTSTNLQSLYTVERTEVSLVHNSFDTIIYSPPYLNNFDYSEIYKIELWLLKFVENYDEWKTLRLGTLRSHYSVAFPRTRHLADDLRTQAIAEQIENMGNSSCLPEKERGRIQREIKGYFDDMYLALNEQWRVLKPGGILTYIVANSRHYYLPIATDVILAKIASCIGFELLDLVVLRKRNGRTRQKLFLRESAVFLRKPFVPN